MPRPPPPPLQQNSNPKQSNPKTAPTTQFNNRNRFKTRTLTQRQFEIYEWWHHLSARLRARVTVNGVGREAVEVAAERARPRPLLQLAVGVKVRPAVLAPWKELATGAVRRSAVVLVGAGERRHRHPPQEAGALARVRVHRETRHRGPHRHDCSESEISVCGDRVRLVPARD